MGEQYMHFADYYTSQYAPDFPVSLLQYFWALHFSSTWMKYNSSIQSHHWMQQLHPEQTNLMFVVNLVLENQHTIRTIGFLVISSAEIMSWVSSFRRTFFEWTLVNWGFTDWKFIHEFVMAQSNNRENTDPNCQFPDFICLCVDFHFWSLNIDVIYACQYNW